MDSIRRIPVNIITGYLGAGKTTFLNQFLNDLTERAVVIINEFGALNIDKHLVDRTDEEIIEINSGCICCNVRKDLIDRLNIMALLKKEGKLDFERIVIESTGVADIAAIVQTFLMDEGLQSLFVIDSVVTLVDAEYGGMQLDTRIEAVRQIAFADFILLNKTDRVTKNDLITLKDRVRSINGTASLYMTDHAELKIGHVLNHYAYDIDQMETRIKKSGYKMGTPHTENIRTVSLAENRPLNPSRLNAILSDLIETHGESLYRYKGIFHIHGMRKKLILQGVHMTFEVTSWDEWQEALPDSMMVIIADGRIGVDFGDILSSCVEDSEVG